MSAITPPWAPGSFCPDIPDVQVWKLRHRVEVAGVLAGQLGIDPDEVRLRRSPLGQPELDDAHGSDLHIGIAHSGGVVLLAVASRRVGIDVERFRAPQGGWALAGAALTGSERAALPADGSGCARAFVKVWVRKEALLKAGGVGLSVEPASIELRGTEILSLPPELGSPSAWALADLDLGIPGFAAALAVDQPAIGWDDGIARGRGCA